MEGGQGVLEHQHPLPDDAHGVGHLVDLTEQVAGDHHRHAKPAGQVPDQLPHLLDARRVQAVGGLVQNQQLGIAQQGRGNAQPLLHPQGIVADLFPPLPLQPDDLQHLPDGFWGKAPEGLHNPQVLLPGEVSVIAGALNETAHLAQHGNPVAPVHGLAKHLNLPLGGADQPQDHLQRGGLPRAVGPQQSVKAWRQGECDPGQSVLS